MRKTYIIPILLGLLWSLLLAVLFAWNAMGERRHVMELAEGQAKAFYQQLVATRSWNSAHGGVFLPEGEGAQPNPYLPSDQRTLTTDAGQTLVRVNPAFMTRQIADISAGSVGVRFRITSSAPVRPENGPDAWEREALGLLTPDKDRFELVPGPDGPPSPSAPSRGDQFRYMAPLVAEESCLGCHPADHVGAIRGGIDVSMPAGPLLAVLDGNLRKQGLAYSIIWLVGLLGLGGSTYEISRKREAAEALSKTRSRFLANMSHDMRTPLTGIIGLSERMMKGGLDPRNEQYARLIVQSAGSLVEIVGDILDFARLESGRLDLEARPFGLRGTVDRTARIFAFAAEEKSLRFEARIDPSVPDRLAGDEFRYRQVLSNLLGNAIKFTNAGFVRLAVSVELSEPADGVLLRTEVADSGVGIHPDQREAIFGSFSQADDSLSRRHAGSGLGLSIARQLARLMGGDVSVSSEPGRGSTFTFTARLALAEQEQSAPARAMAPDGLAVADGEPALPGLRVLAVDDHNANRILLGDILGEAGADVRLASSGREALDLYGRERFDVVLMDMQMPEMDGVETIRRIRAMERDGGPRRTPVVVLTAFAMPGDELGLAREDVDGVAYKPIDVASLKRTILAAAGGRAGSAAKSAPVAAASGPAADAPLLAPDAALKLLGGRQRLYGILTGEFIDGAETLRQDFSSALSRDDRPEVIRLAHTLKTSSASVGALRLRDLAAGLELQARSGERLAAEAAAALADLLAQTVAALRAVTPVR